MLQFKILQHVNIETRTIFVPVRHLNFHKPKLRQLGFLCSAIAENFISRYEKLDTSVEKPLQVVDFHIPRTALPHIPPNQRSTRPKGNDKCQ
ncbi:hypothetical protein M378DRAFT_729551 [Amanita muscaria Koide BX008]|uniref:Uncharacterized protein n=1 Tax=Amanita muscaria (strain Koide BX008) TaxID=946122 RepID=A0A0C2X1Y0_AMAMK|nr:hypothetical protein M378DRAFT_729551 [Amanita muscaria Koide BX008]